MSTVLLLQSTSITGKSAGDPVASWADDSGNSNDATATGTAQPTYQLDGSIPYLAFDGSANAMNAGTLGTFGATPGNTQMEAGATLFFVFKTSNTTSAQYLFGSESTDTIAFLLSLNLGAFTGVTANDMRITWEQGNSDAFKANSGVFATPCDGNLHVIALRFDAMTSGSAATAKAWVDSVTSGTITSANSYSAFQNWQLDPAGLGIGALNSAGTVSGFFNGGIYHIEIQDAPLIDSAVASRITALTAAYTATTPAAPTNITVGTVTSSSVPLSWDAVTGATGYTLQYDTVSTFDLGPTTIEIDTADTQTDTILNLAANKTYYFRVRAKNASGNSDWGTATDGTTQYVSATTLAAAALTADAGTDQTVTDTTATLAGSATGGTEPYNYAWAITTQPDGSAPGFDDDTLQAPTITFDVAGDYVVTLTVTDDDGTVSTDTVAISVSQTATTVIVAPAVVSMAVNATRQFAATVTDQFDDAMSGETVTWTNSGSGSIDASGLYTAPASTGSDTITATDGALTGTASVTIVVAVTVVGRGHLRRSRRWYAFN